MQKKDAKPRLLRWILLLQEFYIEIKDKRGVDNGVADLLSRLRVQDDVPIDDFLPTENIYQMDSSFIRNICLTSETMSTDTTDGISTAVTYESSNDTTPGSSIDNNGHRHEDSFPNKIFIDLEVNIACNKLATYKPNLTRDKKKQSQKVHTINGNITDKPWYADIVNYQAADVEPETFKGYTKKKFMREVRRYYWDEPYLYKHCSDGIYRRCVAESEVPDILFHFHVSDYAGHVTPFKTVSKIL